MVNMRVLMFHMRMTMLNMRTRMLNVRFMPTIAEVPKRVATQSVYRDGSTTILIRGSTSACMNGL
jgi:hypothetical protein